MAATPNVPLKSSLRSDEWLAFCGKLRTSREVQCHLCKEMFDKNWRDQGEESTGVDAGWSKLKRHCRGSDAFRPVERTHRDGTSPEPTDDNKWMASVTGKTIEQIREMVPSLPMLSRQRALLLAQGKDSQAVQEFEKLLEARPYVSPFTQTDRNLDEVGRRRSVLGTGWMAGRKSTEVSLMLYINIVAEIVYFLDFYWRLTFPEKRDQREEMLLHLMELAFDATVIDLFKSCRRAFTIEDLYSLVNTVVFHSRALYDPCMQLLSMENMPKITLLMYAWQLKLCTPSYYIVLLTLNHLDGMLNIIDLCNPYPTHGHWSGARACVIATLEDFSQMLWRAPISALDNLRYSLLESCEGAVPRAEAKRLQPLLECGLCHMRLKCFFTLDVTRNDSQAYIYGQMQDCFEPRKGRNKRGIVFGKNVYITCSGEHADGSFDFFPSMPHGMGINDSVLAPHVQTAAQPWNKAPSDRCLLSAGHVRGCDPLGKPHKTVTLVRPRLVPQLAALWPGLAKASAKHLSENRLTLEVSQTMSKEIRRSLFFINEDEQRPVVLERVCLLLRQLGHPAKQACDIGQSSSLHGIQCTYAVMRAREIGVQDTDLNQYVRSMAALVDRKVTDRVTDAEAKDGLKKIYGWSQFDIEDHGAALRPRLTLTHLEKRHGHIHHVDAHGHGIYAHGHGIHADGHGIHAHGHGIHAHGHGIHAHGHHVGDYGHGIHAHGHGIHAHGHGIHDHGHGIHDVSHREADKSHNLAGERPVASRRPHTSVAFGLRIPTGKKK